MDEGFEARFVMPRHGYEGGFGVDNMGYRAYQTTRVETSSPDQLVQLLYNEAYRSAKLGLEALQKGDWETANNRLIKVQDIVSALIEALDFNIPLAENLHQLYDFVYQQVMQANVKKDAAFVEQALPVLQELRDTWAEMRRGGVKAGQEALVSADGAVQGGFSGDA